MHSALNKKSIIKLAGYSYKLNVFATGLARELDDYPCNSIDDCYAEESCVDVFDDGRKFCIKLVNRNHPAKKFEAVRIKGKLCSLDKQMGDLHAVCSKKSTFFSFFIKYERKTPFCKSKYTTND